MRRRRPTIARPALALLLLALPLVLAAPGCRTTPVAPPPAATYVRAAVAADHHLASAAGVEMLRRGGNAVDAAVAASFCLSVVRPYSCGIGGGGFMVVVEPDGDALAIDYRETCPAAVGPDHYAGRPPTASRFGPHAAGVPGTVAGLLHALERAGTLDRATVLAPAIRAAEHGFPADADHVRVAQTVAERLEAHPELRELASFVWTDLCLEGRVRVGDVIRNPAQARALRLVAERGRDGFYAGPVADAIADVMAAHGGPMTRADLAAYAPVERTPLRARALGHELVAMPPPSSGGIALVQMLAVLDHAMARHDVAAARDAAFLHLLVESTKHAFADRARWLADPGFAEVPTRALLDPDYHAALAARIDPGGVLPLDAYGSAELATAALPADGGTSHISVIDADGMAVACTETINLEFGSLVAVPGFGFVLNDEMDDFTTRRGRANAFGLSQSSRNLPEPGKRPLSSMAPVVVLRDGRPRVIAGASGGPRIITGTAQAVLHCLLLDDDAMTALERPRLHHQWLPDVLQLEPAWDDAETAAALRALGHELGERPTVGKVQLILVDGSGIHAACDPRKGGAPAGY